MESLETEKKTKINSVSIGIRCFDLEIGEHICLNPNCSREEANVRVEFTLAFDQAREIVELAKQMKKDHTDSDLYFIISLAVEKTEEENKDGK